MRSFKTIIFIAFVTLVALVYVHQQVELVKLSYVIGAKENRLKEMLDHNARVGYNIENLEDPSRLEQMLLAKNIDIAMPRPNNIVRLAKANTRRALRDYAKTGSGKRLSLASLLDIFSSKAEAQTKQ